MSRFDTPNNPADPAWGAPSAGRFLGCDLSPDDPRPSDSAYTYPPAGGYMTPGNSFDPSQPCGHGGTDPGLWYSPAELPGEASVTEPEPFLFEYDGSTALPEFLCACAVDVPAGWAAVTIQVELIYWPATFPIPKLIAKALFSSAVIATGELETNDLGEHTFQIVNPGGAGAIDRIEFDKEHPVSNASATFRVISVTAA